MTRDRLLPPVAAGLALWGVGAARMLANTALHGGSLLRALLLLLPPLLYWLAVLPPILWLAARVPLRRGRFASAVAIHLVAAGVTAALYAQLMVWLFGEVWPASQGVAPEPVADWAIRFQFGLMSYGFLLSWGHVQEYFTRMREREVALAQVQTELAQAQLRALKAQLQPHFLFNTLHAITVLIRRDTDAATRMVMRLSDLLRMALLDADRTEVPLEHELRFLRLYIEIEQTRFRDRLEVVWDIPAGLERAAVPPLLLQPLVENALKHGVEARAGGGRVAIAAARIDGTLMLRVTDNGPGLRGSDRHRAGSGIGLASTRGRLEKMYGSAHRFSLQELEGGGVSVSVGVPYRPVETSEGGGGHG